MADRLPRVTAEEVLRALHRDGWEIMRQSGGHALLRHAAKPGRVLVARHRGKTLKLGTLASIIDSAGLTADELRTLL